MFLWVLFHLLWIEDYMNFWNFLIWKRNWKEDEQWLGQNRPKAVGAQPGTAAKLDQGADVAVRAEHGHRACEHPGRCSRCRRDGD
jgi:hypothetical protein